MKMFRILLIFALFNGYCFASEVKEVQLENGLRVLLKRVEGIPLVSVWSWVHAGSANEHTGITGVAHWCEHMNFKGTKKYSREQMKNLLEREGGMWNGYTWLDQTTYFETLPSSALELALDIEAQRLSESLFLPEEVASERSVIISELQMGENDPENLLDIGTTAAAIKAHPYHWPTIGWQSDIESMTRDDLYGFYKRFYSPNNTTLVVVGECNEDEALELIREKFGRIPRGPDIGPLHTIEPEQLGERRVKIEKGGVTPYMLFTYHTPTIDSEDFFPLLALDTLLGGGESINLSNVSWRGQASKSSRLYRGLVDKKIAASAGSLYLPTKYPYLFYVYATAAPGVDLARLEKATLEIVDKAKGGAITESEYQKVINQLRARFVYDTDSVSAQAHMLGFFDTIGDYGFGESFLDRVGEIKKEDIKRAANKYLTEENRTVGWYVPTDLSKDQLEPPPPGFPYEEGEVTSRGPARFREDARRTAASSSGLERVLRVLLPWRKGEDKDLVVIENLSKKKSKPHKSGKEVSVDSAVKLRATRKVLPNGLTLIVRENHISPSIVAYIDIAAGSAFDPSGKHGLANFTAGMLDRGTASMSAALIAETLDSSGTDLGVSCGRDRAAVVSQMLSEKLPMVMEIMAQMVKEPVFPEIEIEKLRGQIVTGLEEAKNDTQQVAVDEAYELIYPVGHPYRHKVAGDIESVESVTRKDLAEFYVSHYGPGITTIVLSGDVETDTAVGLVQKLFGDWKASRPLKGKTVLAPPSLLVTKWQKEDIPDKTQVDVALGFRGIERSNPDYYALSVMNNVLGRFGMGGRLGRVIREEEGLAYYAYSSFVAYKHVGPYLIRVGVNPENVDRAVREVRNTMLGMIEGGATKEELEESKDSIIRSLPRQLETNGAVAAALAGIEFFDLGLDYFERLPDIIRSVSRRDVQRVAHKYLHPENCAIVLAGPVK
jgi:zinc protease